MLRTCIGTVLLCLALAGVPDARAAGASGKVLFVSTRDGAAQIWCMEADGSGQRALTRGSTENTEPAWSPDGTRIAFTSYRDGNAEIYLMNADGSGQRRLTNHPLTDNSPAWTQDGRIVFRSNRDRWANFYSVAPDGSDLRQLTATLMDKGAPVPAPDGRFIAFVGHLDKGRSEIFLLPAGGGIPRDLTGALSKERKFSPAWSPDGRTLAYVESKEPALNVWLIDTDGTNPRKVTDNAFVNAFPSWSPDGRQFAFVSSREGSRMDRARGDIYLMDVDGSQARNLTRTPDEENYPAWSSDGSTIYYVGLVSGAAQIYAVAAQGGAPRRLTADTGNDVGIVPASRKVTNQPRLTAAGTPGAPAVLAP
jgi:TolB protein